METTNFPDGQGKSLSTTLVEVIEKMTVATIRLRRTHSSYLHALEEGLMDEEMFDRQLKVVFNEYESLKRALAEELSTLLVRVEA